MIKELVKQGKITATDGLNRLWAKSDTGTGGTGTEIFKQSRTCAWLVGKAKKEKVNKK